MDRISQNSRNVFQQKVKTPTKKQCSELSAIVVKFFPKLMQSILTDYIKPKGLNAKFRNNDLKVSFTTEDLSLMAKLPKIEDFTISLCYKILRYENLIEEPTCKWGNIPNDNHVKMSDDVLRILHIVNEIISKPDITNDYYLETKQKIELIIRRVDNNLDSDNNQCQELYSSICDSRDDVSTCLNILKTLSIVQVMSTMSLDTNKNQMRERCARLSVLVIDVLPEVLRFIIESKISAVDMYTKCIRILYKFSGIQQASLRLMYCTNTYNSLDIVVLCKLLRLFSHKLGIQPPAQGWGTKPHTADQNTGDDIERISILRNKLAHQCNADICEAKYDDFVGQIDSISSRIDHTYGTRFKHQISERKKEYMDINMQQNYQRAIRELENVQFRHENEPVKFYWGDTFETNLRNIRSMLKNAADEGKRKIRLKIVLTYEKDRDEAVRILNEMNDDINRGLSGIEFIIASPGSIELHVEISMGIIVTDEELQTHIISLLNNVLQLGVLDISSNESIDVYLIFDEDYHPQSTKVVDQKETNNTSEIILDFDVEACIFETEDTMKEKLGNAVQNVMQHANGNDGNTEISATILPLEIEFSKPATIITDLIKEKDTSLINHDIGVIYNTERKLKTHKEMQNRILAEWRVTDKKYISTSATKFIQQSLNLNKGVIITGSPGCGKSAVAHHVALKLEEKGYEIVPCDDPSEIINHFATMKLQVFVIDDVCGKFALDKHKADSWEWNDSKLNMLTESYVQNEDNEDNSSKSDVKFIITCRENIYVHKAFPKLTCFSLKQCSFSTRYKISHDEMRKIALSYLSENIVNDIQSICQYDFFPLLCVLYCKKVNPDPQFFIHPVQLIQQEISKMKFKSESSFLCLSLLVLMNNNVCKDDLRSMEIEQLVKGICSDCEIESAVSMVSIQKCFERLKGIYITEAEDIYTAIHDKIFDIISAAISPSVMECLIKYADITFLANRIQLLLLGNSCLPSGVYIPAELERIYLRRQYQEAIKGKYWEVFGSIQTENEAYRNLFLSFLKEQDTSQSITYVPDEDGSTPLFVSSSLGYVYFVEYFTVKCPNHIDVKDKQGRSPFFAACEHGHIAVVKHLLKYCVDINAEDSEKRTALSAACSNGHNLVAQLLLENNADVNRQTELNQNTFHFASLNDNVQLVSLLVGAYNEDITIRETQVKTAFYNSSQIEHTKALKNNMEFCTDVNQKNIIGRTPLHIACQKGNYETVKLLLGLNGRTLNSCVDTTAKDKAGWSALHAACSNGHTEIVKLLINVGMNINNTTNEGCSPLYLTCQGGHYDTVKLLLDLNGQTLNSHVDTTTKQTGGTSALHEACWNGHTEVVKLLIDVGMNINDTTNEGCSPLYLACQEGHYDTVKLLLDLNGQTLNNGVNTTTKDEAGWSALHVACWNGHTEVVKLLIDVGMNINDTTNEGCSPLYLACQEGHYDTVKLSIDLNGQALNSRVDTTTKHTCGTSALHVACWNGHTEIVKLLIDVGMNINDTTNEGCSPLYLACQGGHFDTVKLLLNLNGKILNSRVDTTTKQTGGTSALHVACWNGHTEIVKLLIDVGVNINDTTTIGTTPLYLACQEGHYDTVKLLLDLNGQTLNNGVDTTIKDEAGFSLLHAACLNGHTEVVKLLIDVGMNINDTTNEGCSPLYIACQEGHYDIVKLLLDLNVQTLISRVDTTIKQAGGRSVLHAACSNGHTEIVKLLIDVGMNINDTTNEGCPPLYLACQGGHYDTMTLLLDLNGQTWKSCVDKRKNKAGL